MEPFPSFLATEVANLHVSLSDYFSDAVMHSTNPLQSSCFQSVKHFPIHHLMWSSQQPYQIQASGMILLWQMSKPKLKEVKWLVQGHTSRYRSSMALNSIHEFSIIPVMGFLLHTKRQTVGASLVVHWLRICLPMQGTQVRSLVGKLRLYMLWGQLEKACVPQGDPAQTKKIF